MHDFSPTSKVWIYTAARPLTEAESNDLQTQLNAFVQQWTAHNAVLKAYAEIYERQLIILVVDETQAGASGCSIDKSVHFLEQQSQRLGVDLFDRMRFGWINADGQVQFNSRDELTALKAQGVLRPDTPMINSLANSLRDLRENWVAPLEKSWHNRLI